MLAIASEIEILAQGMSRSALVIEEDNGSFVLSSYAVMRVYLVQISQVTARHSRIDAAVVRKAMLGQDHLTDFRRLGCVDPKSIVKLPTVFIQGLPGL